MPKLRTDSATIEYEVFGSGHPLLLLAPGGMRSAASMWGAEPTGEARPWLDPRADLSDRFQVIAMDQRNAGGSRSRISSTYGWADYVNDQLALLDHLDAGRAHVMGACIGSSFALALAAATPERITSVVLINPIGRTATNADGMRQHFREWAREIAPRHSELDPSIVRTVGERLWGADFVYSTSRETVERLPTPLLILPGSDDMHPREIALEIASLSRNARIVEDWWGDRGRQRLAIADFLMSRTPSSADPSKR